VICEKQPFGEFERLVTRRFLDVLQAVAKEVLRTTSGFAWWRASRRAQV
jgi:hypothetical protein